MKNWLRGWLGSCTIQCALRVMTLLLQSGVGGGETDHFGGIVCDVCELVPIGGS